MSWVLLRGRRGGRGTHLLLLLFAEHSVAVELTPSSHNCSPSNHHSSCEPPSIGVQRWGRTTVERAPLELAGEWGGEDGRKAPVLLLQRSREHCRLERRGGKQNEQIARQGSRVGSAWAATRRSFARRSLDWTALLHQNIVVSEKRRIQNRQPPSELAVRGTVERAPFSFLPHSS